MPSGQDLRLKFNTAKAPGDKQTYAFDSNNRAIADPVVLDENGLDFRHGVYAGAKFWSRAHYNFTLQSNAPAVTPYRATFEFREDDPWVFQHAGYDFSLDLETQPGASLRYDLNYGTSDFEFNSVDSGALVNNGASLSLSLATERRSWQNINFPNVTNERPFTKAIFELGHDDVEIIYGEGSNINSTNYTVEFGDSAPESENYDPHIRTPDDTIITNYTWDFAAVFAGTGMEVDLTLDRGEYLSRNMFVFDHETGYQVHRGIPMGETLPVEETITANVRPSNQVEYKFDDLGDPVRTWYMALEPMVFDHVANTKVSYSPLETPADNKNDTNFDLGSSDGSSSVNLRNDFGVPFIYGKNLNYEITICPDDLNPPLNVDNHNFQFDADFSTKVCGELNLDFFHGADVVAQFDRTVFIEDIDPEHGHYGEAGLAVFAQLYADGYHGQELEPTLSIYPAAKLDGDAYSGAYADTDFLTIKLFRDVDASHGATLHDLDVATFAPKTFEPNAYNGAVNEFDLMTIPVIQVQEASHGSDGSGDLTIFPAIELDVDGYHGASSDAVVLVAALLEMDSYFGSDSNVDLTTFKSAGLGDVDVYHGGYGESTLSYVPVLDMDGYHGHNVADIVLNSTTTLEMDGYHGATLDAVVTRYDAPQFDVDGYHGGYGETDLAQTKALFPRGQHGATADADLDDHPAIEVTLDVYFGSDATFELDETEFNTHGSHGATLADFNLQVTVNFPTDIMPHGAYAEGDEIKRGASLDIDATHGHNGFLSNFTVPAGETILANAYSGAALVPSLEQPIYHRFDLHPIVASQTLYDGLGGVGGLNHCYLSSDDLDPAHGDNVTRLGYDPLGITDQLIVRFDDIGDDPWSTCNGGGSKFDVAFQTNPRFEAQAYSGEQVHAYFPLQLMPLFGSDVPLDRLYQYEYWAVIVREVFELEEIKVQSTGAVWDHPDDVVAFYEAYFSAELTPTAFAPMYHGAYVTTDLVVPVYGWKHAQKPIETGEVVQVDFEPVDYTRFCKGYIVPNGNAVVFEFDGEIDTDCSIFLGAGGEYVPNLTLRTIQSMASDVANGARMTFSLSVQRLWTLYARHDVDMRVQFYEEPEFEGSSRHGSVGWAEFYEPPIDGYGGATMHFDGLIIPGPAVKWVTETQCLPNEYKPTTEDGDIDEEAMKPDENGVDQVPTVPVEGKPYFANLLAHCITYDTSAGENEE